MFKYRRYLVAFLVVVLIFASLPFSSYAYTGSFNGFNYGIVGFYTADGIYFETERFEINTNGTFNRPNFTGYSSFTIPTSVEYQDHVYSGDQVSFYNSYYGRWQLVEDQYIDITSYSYLHTSVENVDSGVYVRMDVSEFNVEGYMYWSQWFLSQICYSNFNDNIGNFQGWGSPDFNAGDAFLIRVRINYTLEDIVGSISGLSDNIDKVTDAVEEGNKTLSELLQAQQDANEKQDETNQQLQDLNDALKPDGTNAGISGVNDMLSGATDHVGDVQDQAHKWIGTFYEFPTFVGNSKGFAACLGYLSTIYNNCTIRLETDSGDHFEFNIFHICGLLILVLGFIFICKKWVFD